MLAFYGVAVFFHLMPMLCPHFRGYATRHSLVSSEGESPEASAGPEGRAPGQAQVLSCGLGGCCQDETAIRTMGHRGQCPYVLLVLTPTLAQALAVVLTITLVCGFLPLFHHEAPRLVRVAFASAPRAPPLPTLS